MPVIETSGVCGDTDLQVGLVPGPAPVDASDRGFYLWPEVKPGFFRAGDSTAHQGIDYLYSREARLTIGPIDDLGMADKEISRVHGPTLGLFAPLTTDDDNLALLKEDTLLNHPSRNINNGWKNLVYAPCRDRLYRNLLNEGLWEVSETLADKSRIVLLTISAEENGWGSSDNPIPLKLTDSHENWLLLGTINDLKACGTPGAKEWARSSSGQFAIRIPETVSPPADLAGSWISSRVSLDWEEIAVSTSQGVPLSVGSAFTFTDVYIQYPRGGVDASGAICTITNSFPRLAVLEGLSANTRVVVRYRPTGVYGLAAGLNGAVPAVRVPSRSLVCLRHEESAPEEKFSGGRPSRAGTSVPVAISPTVSPAGFLIALAPGHPMHPTHPGTGVGYGIATQNSKLLAWCTPSILYPTTAPGKLRAIVLGGDGIPIPGVNVTFEAGAYLYVNPTQAITNQDGEAFTEVTRQANADGISPVTVKVFTNGILIDQQIVNISLGGALDPAVWVNRLRSGKVLVSLLPGRAKSGLSQRQRLAFWRIQSDGVPCRFSYLPFTITCEEGRLFTDTHTLADATPVGGGGKVLTLTPQIVGNRDWMDNPYIVEYEAPSSVEPDIIKCRWDGGTFENNIIYPAYGQLILGNTL